MLDLRLIREKPDFVKQRLATRGGEDYSLLISELLRCDEQRRINVAGTEALLSGRENRSEVHAEKRIPGGQRSSCESQ